MSNEQLSPREWQKISAYLDNQLSDRERRALEARLQTESVLRQGLEEMRRTRILLRSASRRKAPHNFTLTRAMAESTRPARRPVWASFPAMRLASVVASALLVFTFLGDVALGGMLRSASSVAMESAPAAGAVMDTQAEPTPVAEEPLLNAMEAPEARTMEPTPTQGLMMAMPAPTLDPTQEVYQRMTNAPPGMGMGMAEPQVTATPEPLTMQAFESPTVEGAPELSMKASGETAPYAAPEPTAEPEVSAYPPAEEALRSGQAPFDYTRLFRPAEILFALIAIAAGLGAFLARRR